MTGAIRLRCAAFVAFTYLHPYISAHATSMFNVWIARTGHSTVLTPFRSLTWIARAFAVCVRKQRVLSWWPILPAGHTAWTPLTSLRQEPSRVQVAKVAMERVAVLLQTITRRSHPRSVYCLTGLRLFLQVGADLSFFSSFAALPSRLLQHQCEVNDVKVQGSRTRQHPVKKHSLARSRKASSLPATCLDPQQARLCSQVLCSNTAAAVPCWHFVLQVLT